MLVAKTDSGNACPTSASSASATVIETIANSNGTSPATTEPKTINSTINATGNPNPSSPLRRSSSASVEKSASSVNSPVIETSNPSRPSAPARRRRRLRCRPRRRGRGPRASPWRRDPRRPAAARPSRRRSSLASRPLAQLRRQRLHPPLEARLIDRRRRRANDDHLGDAAPAPLVREALRLQLVGAPRLRIARDLLIARQRVARGTSR